MKKKILNEFEKTTKIIQDKNTDRYNEIVETYFAPQQKQKQFKRFLKYFMPLMACLILLVTLPIILVDRDLPPEYSTDNEKIADSGIGEVSANLNSFFIDFGLLNIKRIERVYDSVSGDTLRFVMSYSKDGITGDLVIGTNRYSALPFDTKSLNLSYEFKGITAKYESNYSHYQLNCLVFIENDGQKILLSYQTRTTSESTELFWIFLEQLISLS